MGYSYYLVDSSIPSVIHVRAESEESLKLSIPARGEIVNVSRQGNSNIPDGAVTIDLSRPLTLKTGNADNLQMQVKLFGILPFKQMGIRVIEDRELIPGGSPDRNLCQNGRCTGSRCRRVRITRGGKSISGKKYFEKR